MSTPKRYTAVIITDLNGHAATEMAESTHGHYVTLSDYAALAAEKAPNDAEFCEMKQDYLQLRIKNAALSAENERLKAELDRVKGERK